MRQGCGARGPGTVVPNGHRVTTQERGNYRNGRVTNRVSWPALGVPVFAVRRFLAFPLVLACTDYDLQSTSDKPAKNEEDTGTFVPDEDTGSEPVDSGDSGEIIIEDSGEPDPEVATEPIYLNTGSALYGYDPTTNTATKVGNFSDGRNNVTDMTDIAIDLSGYMYGVAYDQLYRITPTSAQVTLIARLDAQYNALTFVSTGALVGAAGSSVVSIDTTTGRTSRIGSGMYTSSGDIVGLPDGFLYWSTSGWSSDDLVRVDPTNGDMQNLGSIGQSGVYALGYAYGVLYGFTSGSTVMVIDSSTGRATSDDRLSGVWYGATTNPVKW